MTLFEARCATTRDKYGFIGNQASAQRKMSRDFFDFFFNFYVNFSSKSFLIMSAEVKYI